MVSGQLLGVLFKEGGFLKTENMKHVEVILSTVLEAGPRWRKSCKFSLEDPPFIAEQLTACKHMTAGKEQEEMLSETLTSEGVCTTP